MFLLVVEQVPPCYGIKKKLLAIHNQLFFYPYGFSYMKLASKVILW
jgi:hypothetical protein